MVITGLRTSNQIVQPGPESPQRDPLQTSRAVRLTHDENTFSVEFVGFHFENPSKNGYRYMLEGYDEAWREAGTERQASYHTVAPGRYDFRVKAAGANGVSAHRGRS